MDWKPRLSRLMQTSPSVWTEEMLSPLKLQELQALCLLMGIASTGTKTQLLRRLLDAADLRTILASAEKPTDLTTRYRLKELRQFARRAGVFQGVNKYSEAGSLLNRRNACRRKGQAALRAARTAHTPPLQTALHFD